MPNEPFWSRITGPPMRAHTSSALSCSCARWPTSKSERDNLASLTSGPGKRLRPLRRTRSDCVYRSRRCVGCAVLWHDAHANATASHTWHGHPQCPRDEIGNYSTSCINTRTRSNIVQAVEEARRARVAAAAATSQLQQAEARHAAEVDAVRSQLRARGSATPGSEPSSAAAPTPALHRELATARHEASEAKRAEAAERERRRRAEDALATEKVSVCTHSRACRCVCVCVVSNSSTVDAGRIAVAAHAVTSATRRLFSRTRSAEDA